MRFKNNLMNASKSGVRYYIVLTVQMQKCVMSKGG